MQWLLDGRTIRRNAETVQPHGARDDSRHVTDGTARDGEIRKGGHQ